MPPRKSILVLLAAPLVLLAACTRSDGLYCDENTACTDPAKPFCDLIGSFSASSGVARTCIADPNSSEPDAGTPDAQPAICTMSSQCGEVDPICIADECAACTAGGIGDSACAAKDPAEPICGGDGQCHECGRDLDCDEPNHPICDMGAGTCGACEQHEQCGSGACELETGRCVAEGDIVYADSGAGNDGPFCGNATGAAACRHLGAPLGAFAKVEGDRRYIVLAPGNYIEPLQIVGLNFEIIGNGAQLFPPSFTIAPALEIGAGADIVLHDLTIRRGNGLPGGVGVACRSSSVEFRSVVVRENDSAGVNGVDCNLEFYASELVNNAQPGLVAGGSDILLEDTLVKDNAFQGLQVEKSSSLQVRRSQVVGNGAGGFHIRDSDFTIENTIIANNGNKTLNPSNFAGGIVVVNGAGVSPQIIRHCTIVSNEGPSILGAAGIDCGQGVAAVTCHSNIVVDNEKQAGPSQVGGNCDIRFSNVTGISTGEGNISVAPSFVSAGAGDYHLAAGSAGIDLADPSSPTGVDIDNQSRPNGAGYDMGADERY